MMSLWLLATLMSSESATLGAELCDRGHPERRSGLLSQSLAEVWDATAICTGLVSQ